MKTTKKITMAKIYDINELKRFSRPLFPHYKKKEVGRGTGFFLKQKGHSFLVTAKHVLSGMDYFTKNRIHACADEVRTFLERDPTLPGSFLEIELEKLANILNHDLDLVNQTEFFRISVKETKKDIHINDLIDPEYFNNIPLELVSFGYPHEKFYETTHSGKPMLNDPSLLKGHYMTATQATEEWNTLQNIPFDQAAKDNCKRLDEKYFFISEPSQPGMSGAPVFGKFEVSENGQPRFVYKFMGLLTGCLQSTAKTWVLNASHIHNILTGKAANR